MTDAVELPQVLRRVQEDASAALAFFHTWMALSVASGDDGHRATMNDQRHVDFFVTTMEGCFRLVFLSLGKVFDRDRRSASIKLLARKLKKCGHADLAREIADLLSEHGGTIEQIRLIRGKSVAHCDLTATSKALDDASVTPDQVEELIEASRVLLNRIGERAGFPDTISDGERNERAVQNLIDTLHDSRFPRTKTLAWDQVQGFFEEHGCVVCGNPEIRWYRESWEAFDKAGLTRTTEYSNFELARTALKLRAICLLAMYLGMYQAAGSLSDLGGSFAEHPDVSWYLDSLEVSMQDVWKLACAAGFLETDATTYWDDEEIDDDQLREIAKDLVQAENRAIFDALAEHHDGNLPLFASLWNSRVLPEHAEPIQTIADSGHFGDGKLEVWAYVEERMEGWRW